MNWSVIIKRSLTSKFNNIKLTTVGQKSNVALITINRPSKYNALNEHVISELSRAVAEIENCDEIKAAVITGSDKAFAAGADISGDLIKSNIIYL